MPSDDPSYAIERHFVRTGLDRALPTDVGFPLELEREKLEQRHSEQLRDAVRLRREIRSVLGCYALYRLLVRQRVASLWVENQKRATVLPDRGHEQAMLSLVENPTNEVLATGRRRS